MDIYLPVIISFLIIVSVLFFVVKFLTGNGKQSNKDKNQLMKDANRRLSANPKDIKALQTIGEIYYDEENYEKAYSTYRLLAEQSSSHPDMDSFTIYLRLGLSSMKQKKYDAAYKALLYARSMKQDNIDLDFNLGKLEFMKKNYDKSHNLLKRVIVSRPEHQEAKKYLGLSNFKMKKYNDAIRNLTSVLENDPADNETKYTLGQSFYETGKSNNSLTLLTPLRTDSAMGAGASLICGIIRSKLKQNNEAIMDFNIGLRHEKIKPEIRVEILYRIAEIYTRKNDLVKAMESLKELSLIKPGYKDTSQILTKLKELSLNKNLQIFLKGSSAEYSSICKRLATSFYKNARYKITEMISRDSDTLDIVAEVSTRKWEDVILYRFIRTETQIGEMYIRDLYSRIKDVHAGRGVCIISGSFSDASHRFVEARLIDLIEKDNLKIMLQKLK